MRRAASASLPLSSTAFTGNLRALLSCLREANRDRLFAALDPSSFPPFARSQCALFAATHRAFDAFLCCFAVFPTTRGFPCRHCQPPVTVCRVCLLTGWRMLCL